MPPLPPAFLEQMRAQLGPDFAAFLACYDRPAHIGLRVNTLKITAEDLRARAPFALEPVEWCLAGFRLSGTEEARPGKHPDHAAGLYYLQEPSAMAVAEAAAPQPGEWVLDLAASPGGKSTHLAALLGDRGLLWANEIRTKRVPALAGNLERWGARNLVLSNEPPERLADRLPGAFDAVLVDAPCSGEGMFRKEESVRLEWAADQIPAYAERQRLILHFAARLVRPGGRLIYSTCTFNTAENEAVIADFLAKHPAFQPSAFPLRGFEPAGDAGMRLWPHQAGGEGHFVARLQHGGQGPAGRVCAYHKPIPSSALKLAQAFCKEFIPGLKLESLNLYARGEQLYAAPDDSPDTGGLRIHQNGLWLGTLRKDRFEPAHALAMTLRPPDLALTIDLPASSPAVSAYLRGATLDSPGPDGWLAVCVEGFPLGWGKRVKGTLKNHLPAGLRWM